MRDLKSFMRGSKTIRHISLQDGCNMPIEVFIDLYYKYLERGENHIDNFFQWKHFQQDPNKNKVDCEVSENLFDIKVMKTVKIFKPHKN